MAIITISGTPGSGKSTVGDLCEDKTGFKYVYSGLIFRETAAKYKMSLEDFGKYCEGNEKIDRELDDYQLEILKKDNIILEGRLAGWIAHRNNISALKIFLDADIDVRVGRIINRENGDFDIRKKEMIIRENSEKKRYLKYYNINLSDFSIYDLVIDSGDKTPMEILDIILLEFNRFF